jgi:beta-lactamase class A
MRRSIWQFVLVVVSLAAFQSEAAAQESLQAALHGALQRDLEHVADRLDGVLGYAIKDLSTGESFTRLPDTVFPQASSIKLTVLIELLRQEQEGKLSLEEKHTIRRSEMTTGDPDPILNKLGDGTVSMSLRDLAVFMIVLSDNTATNILIDRLGMESINAEIQRLGLKETKLRRRMIDLEAARKGNENVSTPRDIMTLLEKVFRGGVLDASHTQEYLRILRLPKDTYQSDFRRALPPELAIADKAGSLDAVRCDSGIIEIAGHPIILCVMTTYLQNGSEGERAIEEVARLAYSYFSRLAKSSPYGRPIP